MSSTFDYYVLCVVFVFGGRRCSYKGRRADPGRGRCSYKVRRAYPVGGRCSYKGRRADPGGSCCSYKVRRADPMFLERGSIDIGAVFQI